MTIRYLTSGDEYAARGLLGEGRHQLSILKRLMAFQGLKQLQRIVRFDDGTIIKTLSVFNQDVVEVFVPLIVGEKAIMPRERTEMAIYPALEAYDGNTYASNFIGIVLCKGGGFEPPYEFIAKDSLPRDLVDEPKGALPKERIWWAYYRGDLDDVAIPKSRVLEDIVPVGIAEVDVRNIEATVSECDVQKGGEANLFKTCSESTHCGDGVNCPVHYGRYVETYSYSRSESFVENYGFSYSLDGALCGNWPDYVYEGDPKSGKKKPCNVLNFGQSLFMHNQGSGNNNFINYFFPTVSDIECVFTCTDWFMGICMDGFWSCDGNNDTQAQAAALIIPQNTVYEFKRRSDFYNDLVGSWQYSYREQWVIPYRSYGSVLNSDEYALIYSEEIKDSTVVHSKSVSLDSCIALPCVDDNPCCSPYECEDITTTGSASSSGALIIGLDTEAIQVKPTSQLMYSNIRYHQVGDKSIGLFFVVENYPFEYMYVYVSALESETECIQTQVFDVEDYSFFHEIPGVTDSDDNPVYGNGQMRLIRETITRPEEPLNL